MPACVQTPTRMCSKPFLMFVFGSHEKSQFVMISVRPAHRQAKCLYVTKT